MDSCYGIIRQEEDMGKEWESQLPLKPEHNTFRSTWISCLATPAESTLPACSCSPCPLSKSSSTCCLPRK
eukprot:c31034_g1_i1 orf=3-209(-)